MKHINLGVPDETALYIRLATEISGADSMTAYINSLIDADVKQHPEYAEAYNACKAAQMKSSEAINAAKQKRV